MSQKYNKTLVSPYPKNNIIKINNLKTCKELKQNCISAGKWNLILLSSMNPENSQNR